MTAAANLCSVTMHNQGRGQEAQTYVHEKLNVAHTEALVGLK